MNRNWFKLEISIGTVLQLLTMCALAGGAYSKFDARLTANENANKVNGEQGVQNAKEMAVQSARISELVNQQTRIMTILEERKGRL